MKHERSASGEVDVLRLGCPRLIKRRFAVGQRVGFHGRFGWVKWRIRSVKLFYLCQREILNDHTGRYFSHNLVAANVPKRMELDFVDHFAMSHGSSCGPWLVHYLFCAFKKKSFCPNDCRWGHQGTLAK